MNFRRLQNSLITLSLLWALAGCVVSTPRSTQEHTPTTAPFLPTPTAELPNIRPLTGGLVLEEYPLRRAPTTEPLSFQPVQGTQADALARRQAWRATPLPHLSQSIDGVPFGSSYLDASLVVTPTVTEARTFDKLAVQVRLDGEPFYTLPAGDSSPVSSLQGLWAWDEHWVLEVAYVTVTISAENVATSQVEGQLVQDGILLNESLGYTEVFGFQLLHNQPFYFFQQAGQLGLSYAGQVAHLDYTHILHYGCCSAGVLNPLSAQDMVAFFARQDESWYYVEIGVFE